MNVTQFQYKYLDELQHLWKDINQANVHIKLTVSINDGSNSEIIFTQLPDFTKALVDAEGDNSDNGLLQIV